MKCITVQHKSVLQKLLQDKEYTADISRCKSKWLQDAYDYMKHVYKYKYQPIFLSPVGYHIEMYGANFDKDFVAIELDIPDSEIHIQEYYDWTDFIYLLQNQKEFKDVFAKHSNMYEFGKDILLSTKRMNKKGVYQFTVESIKPEWVTASTENLVKLSFLHNGSGGKNILKELNFYL